MIHAILNGRLVSGDKIMEDCALLFSNTIIGIVSRETLDAAWRNGKSWQGKALTLTDACGHYVSPGFINLHIHGCAGADTMDAKEDTLTIMYTGYYGTILYVIQQCRYSRNVCR